MLKKIMCFLRKEFFELLPPFVFFFLAFNLINMTEALMLKNENLDYANLPLILMGALVVAKVLLVVDNLSFVDICAKRSLAINIVWKTFLYSTAAALIRLAIDLFPFLLNSDDFHADYILFMTGVNWTRFWAIQIWYIVLFLVFVTARDVSRAIGTEKVLALLFGKHRLR